MKGPKYQYKERAEAMSALVTDLKAALDTTHNGQLTFVAEVSLKKERLISYKEEEPNLQRASHLAYSY